MVAIYGVLAALCLTATEHHQQRKEIKVASLYLLTSIAMAVLAAIDIYRSLT